MPVIILRHDRDRDTGGSPRPHPITLRVTPWPHKASPCPGHNLPHRVLVIKGLSPQICHMIEAAKAEARSSRGHFCLPRDQRWPRFISCIDWRTMAGSAIVTS